VVSIAAVAAFGTGVGLFFLTRSGDPAFHGVVTETTTSSLKQSTTTSTTVTTPPPPPAAGDGTLRAGATGPEVARLQQRLVDLGFWLGSPDGTFSTATTHAVVAFQKIAGLPRDGIVGPATKVALEAATRPKPRSTGGHVLEIDLTRQVLFVVDTGTVSAVLDVSTGRVSGTTPTGRFSITRQIDGYHRAPLGVLYRPKYFYQGVAIHGYPSVPPVPASHGCVRTINAAMDWLWSSGQAAPGTAVWVYQRDKV
jgi:lipoprotein-anchoring transpeptidase ErfK/SrfK